MRNNGSQGPLEILKKAGVSSLYRDPESQSFYNRTQSLQYMYKHLCLERSDEVGSLRNLYGSGNFKEILCHMNMLSKMIGNLNHLQYENPDLYRKSLSALNFEYFYQVYDVLFPNTQITNLDLAVGRTIARYQTMQKAIESKLNEFEKQPFGM